MQAGSERLAKKTQFWTSQTNEIVDLESHCQINYANI